MYRNIILLRAQRKRKMQGALRPTLTTASSIRRGRNRLSTPTTY